MYIRKGFVALIVVPEHGELAQMVERSLSMREGLGSMPGFSNYVTLISKLKSTVLTFVLSTGPLKICQDGRAV